MIVRQLNTHPHNKGTVSSYYFGWSKDLKISSYLITKDDNGWTFDSKDKYNSFKLELIK